MVQSIKCLFFSLLILSVTSCGYNKLVDHEEAINKSWSVVANAYNDRGNVVANFVKNQKAINGTNNADVNKLEKTLSEIEGLNLPTDALSGQQIEQFIKKQNELSSVLKRAMGNAQIDNSLINKLEISHNGIREARRKFNNTVAEYNIYKRQFPQNVTAGPMGFDNYEPLKVDEGSRKL